MKAGWVTKTLGEVCSTITRGIAPCYSESGDILVINQRCIRDHRLDYSLARRHDSTAKKVPEQRKLQQGDILINSTGTGTLGRIAQVDASLENFVTVDSHVTIARPAPELFYAPFLKYAFMFIEEALQAAGEGCGGQTELPRKKLAENFSLAFPLSKPEQQRIVGILDAAFAEIAKARAHTEKNLANALQLFNTNLNAILLPKTGSYTETTLGHVCIVERGSSPRPIKKYLTDADTGVNWIKISDATNSTGIIEFTKQKITLEGAKKSRYVKKGDFLLTNSMTYGKPYLTNVEGYIHDGWFVLRPNESIIPKFFYYLLSSPFVQQQFISLANGAIVKNISSDLVKRAKLLIPLPSEQQRIVARLDELSDHCKKLEALYSKKIELYDELKQSLLAKAFSGELC